MTIENRPAIRYHRVTTRRRTLHALQCPLEPELLVAEFGDELPPDIALAVREHIAVCEICGARSQALRQPYELLASLGAEPVHYVPDLRETVRVRARQGRFIRNLFNRARIVGRGGMLAIASAVGAVSLIALVVIAMLANVTTSAGGALDELARAPRRGGALWDALRGDGQADHRHRRRRDIARQIAEVLLVRQQDGVVLRSLPASTQALNIATPSQLPRLTSVAPDGSYVLELFASSSGYTLVAIDTTSGVLRYAVPIRAPGGRAARRCHARLVDVFARWRLALSRPHADRPGGWRAARPRPQCRHWRRPARARADDHLASADAAATGQPPCHRLPQRRSQAEYQHPRRRHDHAGGRWRGRRLARWPLGLRLA